MKFNRKIKKRILLGVLSVFVLMNVVAYFHAYSFTHFSDSEKAKTATPDKLSLTSKLHALVLGIDNPRPKTRFLPDKPYEIIKLQSNVATECWYMNNSHSGSAKGTVILFHGYGGEKSEMLERAMLFDSLGYDLLLVDFMGSAGSEGNTTTIGYYEAIQVKTAFEFVQKENPKDIILFGTSLGAAAIMKAINDYQLPAKALILECPFGSMYETVGQRFDNMKVPRFPMASLLVFWGGVQNGFWAFGHNPEEYAKRIKVPTLLLWGQQDKSVSKKETQSIFENLNGKKYLVTFPIAGHENYLKKYKSEWIKAVGDFVK